MVQQLWVKSIVNEIRFYFNIFPVSFYLSVVGAPVNVLLRDTITLKLIVIYSRLFIRRFVLKLIDRREISYRGIKKALSWGLMRVMESCSSRTLFFWMDTPEASLRKSIGGPPPPILLWPEERKCNGG